MEGLCGGQDSICARVASGARDALGLLAEMQPMGAQPDLRAIEELKSWIRSEFMELVGELRFEQGPNVTRVEEIFSLLLEQMGTLNELMEDEENVTAFPALADQIAALYRSWNNMQQLFEVQIAIVIKHLAMVEEAIDEVLGALDATPFGVEERHRMLMRFDGMGLDKRPTTIDGLLNSVREFVTEAAPKAISAGGGFALHGRVKPAAEDWCDLVRASLHDDNSSAGFRAELFTSQVIRTVAALAERLDEVAWNC